MADPLGKFYKTPEERKRYSIDYVDWLDEGEEVSEANFSVDPVGELEVDASAIDTDGTRVVFFVNGGVGGSEYVVTVSSGTDGGQIKEDTIQFVVEDE